MDIITAQAEERLAELLSSVQTLASSWLCVHVNIAPVHAQALHNEGLSRDSLATIHSMSLQIAHKLLKLGLSTFNGSLFVFEDSDVLALFQPRDADIQQITTTLRKEFATNRLEDILAIYPMAERMPDIVSLVEHKQETAADYRLKRRATEVAERIFKTAVQDIELTRLIQSKRRDNRGSCVLIVEDDILTRGLIASCLKRDHKVTQAKDAYNAIVAYIDNAPDVVFLDIELPDANGHQVLSRLKMLDPQAYVVMLTAHSEADNVLAARKVGAAGFIRKPFSKDKLLSYIMQCPSLSVPSTAKALGWKRTNPEEHDN